MTPTAVIEWIDVDGEYVCVARAELDGKSYTTRVFVQRGRDITLPWHAKLRADVESFARRNAEGWWQKRFA